MPCGSQHAAMTVGHTQQGAHTLDVLGCQLDTQQLQQQ